MSAMSADITTVAAKWIDAARGRYDYDAVLIVLNARFWPRDAFGIAPDTLPSAEASIDICRGEPREGWPHGDVEPLIQCEFEGATEDEVKRAVEVWAREQFKRVVDALAKEFGAGVST